MKNKAFSAATKLGVTLLFTMLACSCASENKSSIPDHIIVSTQTESSVSETSAAQSSSAASSGVISSSSSATVSSTVSTSTASESVSSSPEPVSTPTVSTTQPPNSNPVPRPDFEDPDSYLTYDYNTNKYILPEGEKDFAGTSLFVGDSICLGFSAYGVIESKNVYATGSVAARNLFEYEMYYRNEVAEYIPVLEKVKPENVFLWMGMNDVNMTSSAEYCTNYKKIIDTTLDNTSADVYVCAITPICNLNFTRLDNIINFNNAISEFIDTNYTERVYFVDFTEPLKTDSGTLDSQYDGGDGIHLTSKAYYIALHEINKQMKKNEQ
ncbi:MAG: SGNH/GDSL hydrolase family protein [Oscillospiraceae bacterium]|nr:SGNH/GDSL hydrolase family protein [Oscillospiraceae bacterium]